MKKSAILVLLLYSIIAQAGKIEKGFERLKVYDYFKAKEYFTEAFKGDTAAAAFGLSSIFVSEKNPFYDLDSARYFILTAADAFSHLKPKVVKKYAAYGVSASSIDSLSSVICEQAFQVALSKEAVSDYDHYLQFYLSCKRFEEALQLRNAAAFRDAKSINTAEAYSKFISTYTQAKEITEARSKYEERLFVEATNENDIASYERFIEKYPDSPYRNEAERMIYRLSVKGNLIQQYALFARKYRNSPFRDEAWREVYKRALKDINQSTYSSFKANYPDYPFMNELESDYTLANYTFLPVRKNGFWGFINENGQEMIAPAYDEVSVFSEGLCAVSKEGRSGYINKQGKTIIPLQFSEADDFHNGTAVVKKDSLYGLINRSGEFILPAMFDELSDPSDGISMAMKNEKAGYVFRNGKNLTPFQFDVAGDFKDGYAIVSLEEKYGMIDLSGRYSIQPAFEELVRVDRSLVKALNDAGQWGVLSLRGDTIVAFQYDHIGEYRLNRALVVKGVKCGFVNEKGMLVVPVNFQFASVMKSDGCFKNGFQTTKLKGKPVVIDTSGNVYAFSGAEAIGEYNGGLLPVMKNKKWGYVDLQNKTKIAPKYESAAAFVNGLAKIRLKKQYGVIDTLGAVVVIPAYDDLEITGFGIVVKKEGKKGLLRLDGSFFLACEYDSIDEVSSGIVKLTEGDKVEYVNLLLGRAVYSGN